ncbi:Tyrosine recombinase XerC [Klebsiella quasipneumoniae]|uniref:tyrosine-type recombinase/integrase n=1 Tax=Klebsiella quasipneumoniae TaxID=1463165 RepID=UPI0005E25201|nr:tyrosine-type recombinase/integrase [Klebsiella quasipneumoniae]CEL82334.1 Tyrosine recombinase XerC [Klebsiella quasipneumoniae]
MTTAKIPHVSLTTKDGYVFRKRYQTGTLYLALRTKEAAIAASRGAAVSIRYLELEPMNLPYEAVYLALKQYRDEAIRNEQIAMLKRVHNSVNTSTFSFNLEQPESKPVIEAAQPTTFAEKVAATAIRQQLEANAGHTLLEAKRLFLESGANEWKLGTAKDYQRLIDKFIVWAATKGMNTVEEITRLHVQDFKSFLDSQDLEISYKEKVIVKNTTFFKYCMDVLECIQRNPFAGMNYKNVTTKPKEEITKAQHEIAVNMPMVKNNAQEYWLLNLLYYTGARINEICQITKADYVEIQGIKCISINMLEEGKEVKTEASKRNIPICDALLALGVWDIKPVMKWGLQKNMRSVTGAFKAIGLKRTSHCYRHSMSNRLRDVPGVQDSTRKFILGHAQSSVTDRVYITRAPLQAMLDALNQANS